MLGFFGYWRSFNVKAPIGLGVWSRQYHSIDRKVYLGNQVETDLNLSLITFLWIGAGILFMK